MSVLRTRFQRSIARVAAPVALVILVVGSALGASGEGLGWIEFSSEAYSKAEHSGQPFVVTFGADWCAPCKEMEERTYRDPAVLEAGKGMHFLHVDMGSEDSYVEVVRKSFKVFGAPTTLFFGTDRKERTRRIGFIGPQDYAQLLRETRAATPAAKKE